MLVPLLEVNRVANVSYYPLNSSITLVTYLLDYVILGPANTYSEVLGGMGCLGCPSGLFSALGSTAKSQCTKGYAILVTSPTFTKLGYLAKEYGSDFKLVFCLTSKVLFYLLLLTFYSHSFRQT